MPLNLVPLSYIDLTGRHLYLLPGDRHPVAATKGGNMKCEHCMDVMREEHLVVSGGTVKTKGIVAWHCLACGRVEYRATVTNRVILTETEHHAVQRVG